MRALFLAFCLLSAPFLVPVAFCQPVPATETQLPPVRIGLLQHLAHADAVLISSSDPFTIQNAQTGTPLLHGTAGMVYWVAATSTGITIAQDVTGGDANSMTVAVLLAAVPDKDSVLEIARSPTAAFDPAADNSPEWHHYRGTLTVQTPDSRTLLVVNTLPLEQYLEGVVPAEIGADAPPEALRAQAIAARTYALKNLGKYAALGYDLDDTTHCEGYFGCDRETDACDAAVEATRGMVLAWHNTLIDALFSTDSGGMTACDPTGQYPYFQAVKDAPGQGGPDYGSFDKYHTWTLTLTPAQLADELDQSQLTRVDHFASLAFNGYDRSGRILGATVTGKNGTTKTVTGPQLRAILGCDSLRSTLATLTVTPSGSYEFQGKGWGHGLGMSQDGAITMASPPYSRSYQEILSHYYVGTKLLQIGAPGLELPNRLASRSASTPLSRRGA